MNKKNTNKLFKKYPKLFPKKDRKNPQISLMCFGFECGDGWYWLIDNLCDLIQSHINDNNNATPHLKIEQVVVVQIKEKFGGLRFYCRGGDELINGMVWLAEHLSFHICEICGKEGWLDEKRAWYSVRCKDCRKKESARIKR